MKKAIPLFILSLCIASGSLQANEEVSEEIVIAEEDIKLLPEATKLGLYQEAEGEIIVSDDSEAESHAIFEEEIR